MRATKAHFENRVKFLEDFVGPIHVNEASGYITLYTEDPDKKFCPQYRLTEAAKRSGCLDQISAILNTFSAMDMKKKNKGGLK